MSERASSNIWAAAAAFLAFRCLFIVCHKFVDPLTTGCLSVGAAVSSLPSSEHRGCAIKLALSVFITIPIRCQGGRPRPAKQALNKINKVSTILARSRGQGSKLTTRKGALLPRLKYHSLCTVMVKKASPRLCNHASWLPLTRVLFTNYANYQQQIQLLLQG